MKSIRKVSLGDITMPVRVAHGHLSGEQRIDSLANRTDILKINLDVEYEGLGLAQPHSMAGVWNYGDLYAALCLSDVPMMRGPLEGVLDNALMLVDATAKGQGLKLIDVKASANRMGLVVGHPHLVARRRYEPSPEAEPVGMSRSAGICDFPLVISINHAWCHGNQCVEHSGDRTESVSLSFRAETRAKTLCSDNLSGLYNYAGLVHRVQKMQGIEITGPVEQLCDLVAQALEEDALALGVDLIKTVVEVKRTGYARCTPVLTLINNFC